MAAYAGRHMTPHDRHMVHVQALAQANAFLVNAVIAAWVLYFLVNRWLRSWLPMAVKNFRARIHPHAATRKTAVPPLAPVWGGAVPWQFEERVRRAARAAWRPVNGVYRGTQPLQRLRHTAVLEPITVVLAPVLRDPLAVARGEAPWDGMTPAEGNRWADLVLAGDTGSWPVLPVMWETKRCPNSKVHANHTWTDNGVRYDCPGVWPQAEADTVTMAAAL